jgi:phage shock protein A
MDRVISAIDAERRQYTTLSASVNNVSVQVDQAVRALREEMHTSDIITAVDVKESVSDNLSQLETRVNANLDGIVQVVNDRFGTLERAVSAISAKLDEVMVILSKENASTDVV